MPAGEESAGATPTNLSPRERRAPLDSSSSAAGAGGGGGGNVITVAVAQGAAAAAAAAAATTAEGATGAQGRLNQIFLMTDQQVYRMTLAVAEKLLWTLKQGINWAAGQIQ